MIPVTTFAGKTVAVFGLGGSGLATCRALIAGGATVAAWDDSASGRAAAQSAGIPLVDLALEPWTATAALVLAPGVPLTHPEPHWVVRMAHFQGVEIIGDIELFCRERNALCPEATFIAITGTNGKSTTTALITHILREAGRDVQMGGNIGVPILALEPFANNRIYVIEMSSFQIDLTPSVNPTVGVLLNITPDHLDRHGTMENYAGIKARLLAKSDFEVIGKQAELWVWLQEPNADDGTLHHVPRVSISGSIDADYRVEKGRFWRGNVRHPNADFSAVPSLRGAHNHENVAAAFAVADLLSIHPDKIITAIKTFPGLPHRMEEIGSVGGMTFINDSKATNADSTEKALLSFAANVFWIVGGKPKDGGIDSLRPYFPCITKAYLIGAASDAFAATLEGHVPYERCVTLDVAVAHAARDAAVFSSPGTGEDVRRTGEGLRRTPSPSSGAWRHLLPSREKTSAAIVLLSPACASYDQFANFEQRGEAFRNLVSALPGFVRRGGL